MTALRSPVLPESTVHLIIRLRAGQSAPAVQAACRSQSPKPAKSTSAAGVALHPVSPLQPVILLHLYILPSLQHVVRPCPFFRLSQLSHTQWSVIVHLRSVPR